MTKAKVRTWVITSGDYSDYRVHATFTGTEAEVKAFLAEVNPDAWRYSRYEYIEVPAYTATERPARINVTTYFLSTELDKEGNVFRTWDVNSRKEPVFDLLHPVGTVVRKPSHPEVVVAIDTTHTSLARTRKAHAEKVAEQRQRLIEGLGDAKEESNRG